MLDSLDTLIAFVLIMLVVSLLITIAVQMVVAALNLRGLNLLKGLAQSVRAMAPDLDKQASQLAGTVLKGGTLSDSSFKNWPPLWRLATAARPDEIFDSIHRIAIGQKKVDSEGITKAAKRLLSALGLDLSAGQNVAQDLSRDVALLPEGDLKVRINNNLAALTDYLQSYAGKAATAATAGAAQIDRAYEKFEYCYEIAEERVQQWFTTHTRIITIVFAFIFAFWLQLDAVDIFRLVSTNRAVRDKLVAQAGVSEAQAAKTLAENKIVQQQALTEWKAKQTDPAVLAALGKVTVGDNETRDALRTHINNALTDKLHPVGSFDGMVNAAATAQLENRAREFNLVKADLDRSGFDILPSGQGGRWGASWWDGFGSHFWGMIFSVALLSLGAPFWYNCLKNLTSLRSAVAENISEEKNQASQTQSATLVAAGPAAAPAVKAPPTVR